MRVYKTCVDCWFDVETGPDAADAGGPIGPRSPPPLLVDVPADVAPTPIAEAVFMKNFSNLTMMCLP